MCIRDRTRQVQASLPVTNRRAMSELDKLIRALEDECREGHAVYMHDRPALLKICDALIDSDDESTSTAA